MTIVDVSAFLKELLILCAPSALMINFVQFGVNALISAITGKGIKLNGK